MLRDSLILMVILAIFPLAGCIHTFRAGEDYPPPEVPEDTSLWGTNYQRTMRLLATSAPDHRHNVKIIFYGQSITAADWWERIAADLRERFPHADLEVTNKAIGGFASQKLSRVAEHDIYPEYPDLIIFHVFGAHTCYEEIIASIRSRTTAEIAIWTDHLKASEEPNGDGVYENKGWTKFMAEFLPKVAEKYGCGFIEIREPWKQYVIENGLEPGDLLKDNVHVNDYGGYLLSQLIGRELVYNPDLPLGPSEGMVRTYRVGEDVDWEGDSLTMEFAGNRVDLIPTPTDEEKAPVRVLIDGRAPSTYPGCYAYTRPSTAYGTWGPGILRVTFNERPLVEDWTIRVTGFDPETKAFTFDAIGSKTGQDGSGISTEDFVSDSGRVVIKAHVKPPQVPEQTDWRMQGEVPVGFEVTWTTIPMFVDRYEPPAVRDTTREHAVTVAQGFPNGRHTLTLERDGDGTAGIAAIRVYRPPLVTEAIPEVASSTPNETEGNDK